MIRIRFMLLFIFLIRIKVYFRLQMKDTFDIIVIGGGASGLMAAGRASELGTRVAVLEKKHKPALKLGLTGKGRCNICNAAALEDAIGAFGPNGKFLYNCFGQFFTEETLDFFETYGLTCKLERGGRYFPVNDSAHAVRDALLRYNKKYNTSILLNHPVLKLEKNENGCNFHTQFGTFRSHSSIIATGGLSYPATGSEGDGYEFARQLGHSISPLKPGLAALITQENVQELEGLSLRQVCATLFIGDRRLSSYQGHAFFTAQGLSGPIILTLSLELARQESPENVSIAIDWKPALDWKKLSARLDRDIQQNPKKSIKSMLKLLLPGQFIATFLSRIQLEPEKTVAYLTRTERNRIIEYLKDFRFTIQSPEPISNAIITEGGVDLREIDPKTMESKIQKGLYFTGEILDLAGRTGGFNLQMAWSTGYAAGEAATRKSSN